jgi:glycosyltransferase involved in cell wall biosynthesis
MKNNMHILVLPSWYVNSVNPLSGIFFKEQAEALVGENVKVGVLAVCGISIKKLSLAVKLPRLKPVFSSINGVKTAIIECPSIPKLKKVNRFIFFNLGKILFKKYIIENGVPDIIHLHSFIRGDLAIWIFDNYEIPYIVTEHSTGFARDEYLSQELNYAKSVFINARERIAVSEPFRKLLANKFKLKFNCIPNIVDTDFFSIKPTGIKDTFTFINIGFLDKKKNQKMLIDAFWASFSNEEKIKLVIVGSGPELNRLREHVNELGAFNQVSLYGVADRVQVRDLLHSSDVFVLASKFETFGVVLIEAMSCGLPVISTRCGGPEDIISSDIIGELCDIEECELANSLIKVHKKHKNNDYNPVEIRLFAEQQFSSKVIAKKLSIIYNEVVM